MLIEPKMRGFICTTAHPDGCAAQVQSQVDKVLEQGQFEGPRNALIIGSSTGYGLSSRIVNAFGAGAHTLGIAFERPASGKRTATAGWYNTAAFEKKARAQGLYAETIMGDAFSDEMKQQAIEKIKNEMGGKIDLVVYSLASPRRTHPRTGETFTSVLKPIETSYTNKTVDIHTGEVTSISIEPANEEEIRQTIAVMGGEDWSMWLEALLEADVLAEGVTTLAYSYIGPELTYPVYREGTIGRAKDDLEETAKRLDQQLQTLNGRAVVSVNKALVTQSSAAIPVVPLYISLLFKIMKEKGLHEGCIEQMNRLFRDHVYSGTELQRDDRGRVRIDDLEMKPEVQDAVSDLWEKVNSENIRELADLDGYLEDFYQLFGFKTEGIDYSKETNPVVER